MGQASQELLHQAYEVHNIIELNYFTPLLKNSLFGPGFFEAMCLSILLIALPMFSSELRKKKEILMSIMKRLES